MTAGAPTAKPKCFSEQEKKVSLGRKWCFVLRLSWHLRQRNAARLPDDDFFLLFSAFSRGDFCERRQLFFSVWSC